MAKVKQTCLWPGTDELMNEYHDEEWGIPVHDDKKHFEFIVLDTFQAGLSWKTILHKRENFRKAFDKFDVKKISKYDEAKVQSLLQDAGIIRNQLKVRATITNAQSFMAIQKEFGDFDSYIWQFVKNKPITNKVQVHSQIPATSPESDAMSKDLYKRGFKFVGSTICYAYMQAAGMVNDHLTTCFRFKEVKTN
ncbi:MAG: DNA-3-methyladenine glycosylase I [Bacteroidetes bacterium]|nr:DNA-3-methyladenine glycosylase I [Bacteroidota bacterium]